MSMPAFNTRYDQAEWVFKRFFANLQKMCAGKVPLLYMLDDMPMPAIVQFAIEVKKEFPQLSESPDKNAIFAVLHQRANCPEYADAATCIEKCCTDEWWPVMERYIKAITMILPL